MSSLTATMTSPSSGERPTTLNRPVAPLDLVADADAEHARQLRIALQHWLQSAGVDASLRDDLTLAVYEALANVVEHAYPSDHPHPVMRLRARMQHDDLLITVVDQGRWLPPSNEASYRGRGLTVMRALSTQTHLQRTELRHHGVPPRGPAVMRLPAGDGIRPSGDAGKVDRRDAAS